MRRQVRTLVDALAEHHDVCVVALRWPDQAGPDEIAGVELRLIDAPAPTVASRAGDRLAAVARGRPVDWARLARPFLDVVPALLAERGFDVAHVALDDLSGVAPALAGVPAVVAPLDARHRNVRAQQEEATGVDRQWRAQQERAIRRTLATALRPFRAAVFVTEDDAAAVRDLDPALRTVVIPIAVDAAELARPPTAPPRDPGLVVFTGALSAPANAAAARRLAERILPLARQAVPEARLALVGRAPTPSVRALGTAAGVEVVADVPDLRPWLWRAGAYACPMEHGTGMKTKLLEAMAAGAAAVATPAACRGLAAVDGEHLVRAETDEALAAGIVGVLQDEARRDRLGAAARDLVAADHAPAVIAARYGALYEDVIRSSGSGSG